MFFNFIIILFSIFLLIGIQFVSFMKDLRIVNQNLKVQSQIIRKTKAITMTDEQEEACHYILFNPENGIIYGISTSCYRHFGIPSSLIYGNSQYTNEFNIDSIIPELMNKENIDFLRNENGVHLTLDTSVIQQNFLIAKGESDRDSDKNDHDEENSEYMYQLIYKK